MGDLTPDQIAEIQAMWLDQFDTHEIALALGIEESVLWNTRVHQPHVDKKLAKPRAAEFKLGPR